MSIHAGHPWVERGDGRVLVRSVESYPDGPLRHETKWECDCGAGSQWRGYCARSGATTSPDEMTEALDAHLWEEKAHRLAIELREMRTERDVTPMGKRWTDLCRAITKKRYEIEGHLAAVP